MVDCLVLCLMCCLVVFIVWFWIYLVCCIGLFCGLFVVACGLWFDDVLDWMFVTSGDCCLWFWIGC